MEHIGEIRTSANRAVVWAGLRDSAVLERCIERCIEGATPLQRNSDHVVALVVSAQRGGQDVLFDTSLQFAEVAPNECCTLTLQAKNSATGGIAGVITARLTDERSGTRLSYQGEVEVGEGLAELDQQMVDQVASQTLNEFFTEFEREMNALTSTFVASGGDDMIAVRSEESYQPSQQGVIWAIMFGVLILAVVLTL